MFFWLYMVFASLNLYLVHYFEGLPNSYAHLLMFIYSMIRGWEQSKKDGIEI